MVGDTDCRYKAFVESCIVCDLELNHDCFVIFDFLS